MARYIDADKLLDKRQEIEVDGLLFKHSWYTIYDNLIKAINDAPTADVVEVKHGEWLDDVKVISTVGMADIKALVGYRCSLCGRTEVAKEPYCNCGAKMDGGKAE